MRRGWSSVGQPRISASRLRTLLSTFRCKAESLLSLDDVTDLSVVGERRHFQHIGQNELGVAVLGVFFQQFLEYLPGRWDQTPHPAFGHLLPIGCGEGAVALGFQALRALAAGAERGVEREMAEQIERVGVRLLRLLGWDWQLVQHTRFSSRPSLVPSLCVNT